MLVSGAAPDQGEQSYLDDQQARLNRWSGFYALTVALAAGPFREWPGCVLWSLRSTQPGTQAVAYMPSTCLIMRLNTHLLQLAQGYVMLCVAYPTGDCVIDTHQYSNL